MNTSINLSNLDIVKIAAALQADIEASKKEIDKRKRKKEPYDYLIESLVSTQNLLERIEKLL